MKWLACLVPAALSGCLLAVGAAAAAGVGAYMHLEGGWMARDYRASVGRAWNGCIQTCDRMKLAPPTAKAPPDALGGEMRSRRPDGTEVAIQLKSMGAELTRVFVRFGTFGDQSMSRTFHEHLAAVLAEGP